MNRFEKNINYELNTIVSVSIIICGIYQDQYSNNPSHIGWFKMFIAIWLSAWLIGSAISALLVSGAVWMSGHTSETSLERRWPYMMAMLIAPAIGGFAGISAVKLLS